MLLWVFSEVIGTPLVLNKQIQNKQKKEKDHPWKCSPKQNSGKAECLTSVPVVCMQVSRSNYVVKWESLFSWLCG